MGLVHKDQVPVRSLLGYMTQPDRVLIIPPWQREYVWSPTEEGEIGILLNDLKDFFESPREEYLMGSVILAKENQSSEDRVIIDGQQRTLTFLIFLLAASKYISNANLKQVDNLAHEKLSQDMRSCLSFDLFDYRKRISMNQQQANSALQTLFAWSKVADGELSDDFIAEKEHWTETHRNIVIVAEWLYEKRFKSESWLVSSDFLNGIRKIIDGVKFIEVTLTDQQEAIAVFDQINDRGADLNSGDLIKNRIFMSVENEEDYETISNLWTSMRESLVQCSLKRLKEPKFLLRALALSEVREKTLLVERGIVEDQPETKIKAEKITYEKLTKFWGDRLNPPKNKPGFAPKLDPVTFSENLVVGARWLHALSRERTINADPLKELYFTRYLKSVQHYPILIAAREISEKQVFLHLVRQVHNRTAFYLLSDESNQDFESMIPKWTSAVAQLGKNATIEKLNEIYQSHFAITQLQINLLFEQFSSWNYKDATDKKKIRAVLSQLSRIVDKCVKKEDSESPESYFKTRKNEQGKSWDIDHVAPGGKEERHSRLHTIGNLVLLHPSDNRSKKDASPKSKTSNYSDSNLYLTKTLAQIPIEKERIKIQAFFDSLEIKTDLIDLNSWNSKAIDQRSILYFKLLAHHLTSVD